MNKQVIENTCPNQTIFDDQIKGLQLRHYPSGRKSFLYYYKTRAGIARKPKLGEYPALTIQDARKLAKELMLEVAIGNDPSNAWKKQKAEPTVLELFGHASENLWSEDRYQKSGWAKEAKRLFFDAFSLNIRSMKASDLDATCVRQWKTTMAKARSPYTVNRALEVLSRIYTFASQSGFYEGPNPAQGIQACPEVKRDRHASESELRVLLKLLEVSFREGYQREVAFLLLLMFTGSRPRAIERAKWDQLTVNEKDGIRYGLLSFEGKSSAKSGSKEQVIIPPQIMWAIDVLPKTSETITGIRMPKKFWAGLKAQANCPDLWARDFRRSFASIALSNGVGLGVVGELLNHKSAQTTKLYAKLGDHARLEAASMVGEKLGNLWSGM